MLSARFLPIICAMKRCLCFFISSLLWFVGTSVSAEETGDAASSSAATPSMPTKPRTEPDVNQTIIDNLLKQVEPGTEILQLETGHEGEKLIAFLKAEGSGIKQGGIIIFPDENTHLNWPGDLNALRTTLPDYGWYTLATYLPQTVKPKIPKRTLPVLKSVSSTNTVSGAEGNTAAPVSEATNTDPATEQNPTTAETATPQTSNEMSQDKTEEKPEPYQDKVFRLGQTAHRHLQQEGINRFVVMGLGTGAVWASSYVKQFEDAQDLRLVLIDPETPKEISAPDLITLLPEIKSTIIDLYHSAPLAPDNMNPISAERRLRVARTNKMNHFHQSRLPFSKDDWKKDNPWLVKFVRGMLNTHVIKAEAAARSIQVNGSNSDEDAPGMMKAK